MLTFNLKYGLYTCCLFIIEVIIALYVHDQIIRPYMGDVLVVILLYCFVKTFIQAPPIRIACWVLLFSYVIEALQYLKFIHLIGLQKNTIANIIFGNTFSWFDILSYTVGILLVLLVEWLFSKWSKKPTTTLT